MQSDQSLNCREANGRVRDEGVAAVLMCGVDWDSPPENWIPLCPWRVDPATSWLTHGPHISDKDNLLSSIHTSGNAQALLGVGTWLAQFYGMQIELVFILLI